MDADGEIIDGKMDDLSDSDSEEKEYEVIELDRKRQKISEDKKMRK